MKNQKDKNRWYFIESLTVFAWLFYIFPYIVRDKFKGVSLARDIYFIDATKFGIVLAHFMLPVIRNCLKKLEFQLIDVKDDQGLLLRLRIAYFDFSQIQKDILSRPIFQKLLSDQKISRAMYTFLSKQITHVDLFSNNTVWRAQLITQIALWKLKEEKAEKSSSCVLFMNKRLWTKEIDRYGLQYGVKIVSASGGQVKLKSILILLAASKLKLIQSMYFYIEKKGLISFIKEVFISKIKGFPLSEKDMPGADKQKIPSTVSPKLLVEYLNHFNLGNPELNSDLFFWQQSEIKASDILLIFNNPKDPLDEKKWQDLNKYRLNAVALSPKANLVPGVEEFYYWLGRSPHKATGIDVKAFESGPEKNWLKQQLSYYSGQYNYWVDFFKRYNIKINFTWFKYDSNHCIITEALRDTGGIATIYQRAFEEFPAPETIAFTDIVFGFSKKGLELERSSKSTIPYYVITGYFGDYRFPLLKNQAQDISRRLKSMGAQRILSFFDENSAGDSRWHTGHEFMRVNYEFLLSKVLEKPWLGLIAKPKVPSTLRQRLGPLADLLKKAEATGRCYVFEEGASHGSYPPAVAALASDIAIHGHMAAATAGLEAALTGTPTLLLDREGWAISSLYKLGLNRVVFNNWQDLWKACKEYWVSPVGIPGFGNWSLMLDELDPFRDGRAAERIGTYLKWLMDSFKSGLNRQAALADAAERYGKIWGKDKIAEIKGPSFFKQELNQEVTEKVTVCRR